MSRMKKKNHGCLIIMLSVIALLIAGIAGGKHLWEQNGLRNAAKIDCPVFDTQAYTAGTEFAGRDLTNLLSGSSSTRFRMPGW